MELSYNMMVIIIFGAIFAIVLIAYLVSKAKLKKENKKVSTQNNGSEKNAKDISTTSTYKKNPEASIPKEDIFNFMEFDKIQDNMIIQQKGEKFTAVIKCKGINYNLMSEIEQLAVEEGFINFLNTLKFPIQLYVQAQRIDLAANIEAYKDNMKAVNEEFDDISLQYNMALNSLETSDEELDKIEQEKNSVLNVLEYGKDIVKYVERLSLNKNMLQRSFYILVSYYKSELSNASSFKKEEFLDICFSELFTRVQNIISGLSMCSVNAVSLNSNEIADLLYSGYNRDDKNYMSVQQALEAGFHRLYSTSLDAITKKQQRIVESIKQDAEYKAIMALNKALEEEDVPSEMVAEDLYDQESSKQAIEIIKRENVSEKIKKDAKKIIVEDYKNAKKERLERHQEYIEQVKEKLGVTDEESENNIQAEQLVNEESLEQNEDAQHQDTNV